MSDFDYSQATQLIKTGDVQGARAALKSALTGGSSNLGTAEITPNYDSEEENLVSLYTLEVTEPGVSLGIILVSVVTDQDELLGGELVAIDPKQNKFYLGVDILTGLASKHEGQTLNVAVTGTVFDTQGKVVGNISAQANVAIN